MDETEQKVLSHDILPEWSFLWTSVLDFIYEKVSFGQFLYVNIQGSVGCSQWARVRTNQDLLF